MQPIGLSETVQSGPNASQKVGAIVEAHNALFHPGFLGLNSASIPELLDASWTVADPDSGFQQDAAKGEHINAVKNKAPRA